jgi:iron(III) transport system permease protein
MESTKFGKINGWKVCGLILLALSLVFIVYPMCSLLYKSVVNTDGAFTFEYFARFFSRKLYVRGLVNSIEVTLVCTAVCMMIGLPLALVMKSVQIRGEKILQILIIISYVSPPMIGAYSWIQLLGRNGFVTRFLGSFLHLQFPGIYGFPGIVLVFSMQATPLVFLYVSGALKNMDSSLMEAAESLGCSPFRRMTRIVVPLIMPTLLASALIVFIYAFTDFATPMIIGEGYDTFPSLLYNQFMGEVSTDNHFASALSVMNIVFIIVIMFAEQKLVAACSHPMNVLKPLEPRKGKGIQSILAHAFSYFWVLLFLIPQATVFFTSFLEVKGGIMYTGNFSLDNYRQVFLSKDHPAVFHTYLYGLISILFIVGIGVVVAYMAARKPSAVSEALDAVTMVPFIIPGTVLGIAYLYTYNTPPIYMAGTGTIIIIAMIVRRMPYTIRSSNAILSQISPSVEEAAVSLGASDATTFFRVTVPMMLPGILPGAVLSWITVICELATTIIIYTADTKTLPILVYTGITSQNYGLAGVYSAILTVTSVLSLILFFFISGKREITL